MAAKKKQEKFPFSPILCRFVSVFTVFLPVLNIGTITTPGVV